MAADLAGAHQRTVGADKNYDTNGFVAEMRRIGVTPHVAQNTARSGGSAFDGRTTRHVGYAKSIKARRGIEKVDELRSTSATVGSRHSADCGNSNCVLRRTSVPCTPSEKPAAMPCT